MHMQRCIMVTVTLHDLDSPGVHRTASAQCHQAHTGHGKRDTDMAALKPAELAARIKAELDTLSLHAGEAAHDEVRRVLNQGCPLADLINAGLVHGVTREGRESLEVTLAWCKQLNAAWCASPEAFRAQPHWFEYDGQPRLAPHSWSPMWDAAQAWQGHV